MLSKCMFFILIYISAQNAIGEYGFLNAPVVINHQKIDKINKQIKSADISEQLSGIEEALAFLYVYDEYDLVYDAFIDSGILSLFKKLLFSSSEELRIKTLCAVRIISKRSHAYFELIAAAGIVENVVQLLSSDSSEVRRSTVDALEVIMETVSKRVNSTSLQTDVLHAILIMVENIASQDGLNQGTCSTTDARKNIFNFLPLKSVSITCETFRKLLFNDDSSLLLVSLLSFSHTNDFWLQQCSDDIITHIMPLLGHSNAEIQCNVIIILYNLVIDHPYYIELILNNGLLSFMKTLLIHNDNCVKEESFFLFYGIVKDGNHIQTIEDANLIPLFFASYTDESDLFSIACAILSSSCFANVKISDNSIKAMLPIITKQIHSHDEKKIRDALSGLVNLKNVNLLIHGDIVETVIRLLKSDDHHIQEYSLRIIANIAKSSVEKVQYLFDKGILDVMNNLIRNPSDKVSIAAAHLLLDFLGNGNDSQVKAILNADMIYFLTISPIPPCVLKRLPFIFVKLCFKHYSLLTDEIISEMLLSLKHIDGHHDRHAFVYAVWGIHFLSQKSVKVKLIVESGIVEKLISYLTHDDDHIQDLVLPILLNIIKNKNGEYMNFVTKNDVLETLKSLFLHGNDKIKTRTLNLFRYIFLYANEDQFQVFLDANVIPLLMDLLNEGNLIIKKIVLGVIYAAKLNQKHPHIESMVTQNLVGELCKCLKNLEENEHFFVFKYVFKCNFV